MRGVVQVIKEVPVDRIVEVTVEKVVIKVCWCDGSRSSSTGTSTTDSSIGGWVTVEKVVIKLCWCDGGRSS